MTPTTRERVRNSAAIALVLLLGVALRLVALTRLPPGPWIDEVYFLRAARVAAGPPRASFSDTTPLLPPEFSAGELHPSNAFLWLLASIDRAAGGGLASLRAMSAVPSVLLLFGAVTLAWEATRGRSVAFLPGALLVATSIWLLPGGRWAVDVVWTSALLTWAAASAMAARRRESVALAGLAGVLLGASQYGYVQARLALLAAAAVLAFALLRREREIARVAATVCLVATVTALPLARHIAESGPRAMAHLRDISIFTRPGLAPFPALAANVVDYAALFTFRGDLNVRHGDPTRPVVLAGVAALLAIGLACAVRRPGPERFLATVSAAFLVGALLARDTEYANASRLSPAAPFLLVLAALGGAALLGRVPTSRRRLALAGLWAVVGVSSLLDVAGFLAWGASPRLEEVFGGRERRLADAIAAEKGRVPADVLLHPYRAARNVYLVDVLLGRPGDGGRHAVRVGTPGLETSWLFAPSSDLLYAAGADPATRSAVETLGGQPVAVDRVASGVEPWALYRIPRGTVATAAGAALARVPRIAAAGGDFEASEDGLYVFSAHGDVAVTLAGRVVLEGASPPGPPVVLHLAKGRHPLEIRKAKGATLRITGPDGFAVDTGRPGT